ncbi:hypothetical protein [Phreatobacter oligotrophus]|uniref:hypothetical protein n=1 Tax=Phreatobacter oligotrophus TaxID=1122261 RepID=UPI002353F23D|nr:hypothetical protein [Phreatobacter oligotrophus]MBX9990907.1 hypothetical protein [Phreatobacter oligotrophus]
MSPAGAADLTARVRAVGGRLMPLLLPLLLALGLGIATAPDARHAGPDLAGGLERQADLTAVLRPPAAMRAAVRPAVAKPGTGADAGDDRIATPHADVAALADRGHRAAPQPPAAPAAGEGVRRLRPEPRAPPA